MKQPTKLFNCPKCKKDYPYDQPIIMEGCIGYATTEHECVPQFSACIVRPSSEKEKAFWNTVKEFVKEQSDI